MDASSISIQAQSASSLPDHLAASTKAAATPFSMLEPVWLQTTFFPSASSAAQSILLVVVFPLVPQTIKIVSPHLGSQLSQYIRADAKGNLAGPGNALPVENVYALPPELLLPPRLLPFFVTFPLSFFYPFKKIYYICTYTNRHSPVPAFIYCIILPSGLSQVNRHFPDLLSFLLCPLLFSLPAFVIIFTIFPLCFLNLCILFIFTIVSPRVMIQT